jgi:predicted sulfurtransferase
MEELDRGRPTVVFCAGGYRSSVAASTLRAAGFSDVSDLVGGYQALVATEAVRQQQVDAVAAVTSATPHSMTAVSPLTK